MKGAVWRDGILLATVLLVDARAFFGPFNELAWLTAIWFTTGAAALLLLPRVLPAASLRWVRWSVVAAALTQLPFMAWQVSQGLPLAGWTGGPGSRYAAVLLAVAVPLAPVWGQVLLGVALAFSQSFLALAAVLTALATMMEGRLRRFMLAWMVACMTV